MAEATTSKPKRKSRFTWDRCSEEVLLQLWEDKMPQFRGNRRNSHIHQEIAAEFQERGFVIQGAEVKIKIHNLTNKYREENKKTGPPGGSPSTWMWFDRVHSILGSFKSLNLETLNEESSVSLNVVPESDNISTFLDDEVITPDLHLSLLQNQSSNEESSSCCEPEKKKLKLSGFHQVFLEEIKKCNKVVADGFEGIKECDKEAIQIQKEMLEEEKRRNNIFEQFMQIYSEKKNK